MRTLGPACLVLIATPGLAQVGAVSENPGAAQPSRVVAVEMTGGTEDDRVFAREAMAVDIGTSINEDGFQRALVAAKATDRFRGVDGRLERCATGFVVKVQLDPWPSLRKWHLQGKSPLSYRKILFPEMRTGIRVGDARLRRWQEQALTRLRDAGYPSASVQFHRNDLDQGLLIEVKAGAPNLIRACELTGDRGPYLAEDLIRKAGIIPGRTLWSEDTHRDVLKRLRRFYIDAHRYEGQVEAFFEDESGKVILKLHAGPVIKLQIEGEWSVLKKNLADLIPIARAGSYSPEVLEEGRRRILKYLFNEGYLEATVAHHREAMDEDLARIVYTVHPGKLIKITDLQFESTHEIPETELRKVAALPKAWLGLGPVARPELIDSAKERIRAHFQSLGYSDFTVRALPLVPKDGKATLRFRIQMNAQRFLSRLELKIPDGPGWQPWTLAECLTLVISSHPIPEGPSAGGTVRYQSDRPALKGVTATIRETTDGVLPGFRRFSMVLGRPIPYLKGDIGLISSALRQRVASLGAQKLLPRPQSEDSESGVIVRFEVLDQSLEKVKRLIVRGADQTRAKAIFREIQMEPGTPLDPDHLSKAESRLLGNLGAFQKAELSKTDADLPVGANPWEEGDLQLSASERPPWVLSSSFGYDKSQGYHIGLGAQRLNVGGMGRTVDFGIRAGDGTIQNPTLRRMFPTGQYDRSVDVYSIGYTDPWFSPGFAESWLPDRTRYHAEASYIEEHQDVYLMRRRRVTNDFEWRVGDFTHIKIGHRFERAEVKRSGTDISDLELALVSRNPGRSIISAPYAQLNRDTRDSALDPTEGQLSSGRIEFANQLFGTSANSSFVKVDLKQQWNWGLGYRAAYGVVSLGLHAGLARPTASTSQDLPLSERFFAGGPTSHRGVEPDQLGPYDWILLRNPDLPVDANNSPQWKTIPLGGQALALINLEYRFPVIAPMLWGEVFVDSGQVYQYLNPRDARAQPVRTPTPPPQDPADMAAFPPFRTSMGCGLILKIGIPIKLEYASDIKRILGQPRTQHQRNTQLRSLLISAGFQF